MNDGYDIATFVKEPSLLIELCQAVIDELTVSANDTEVKERKVQLHEISKTIERLEKVGVSVPDGLRHEKLRLACAFDEPNESREALCLLLEGLRELTGEIAVTAESFNGGTTAGNVGAVSKEHDSSTHAEILNNWGKLNHDLASLQEDQLRALINYECSTKKRRAFIERMHQRYAKIRAARERVELVSGQALL